MKIPILLVAICLQISLYSQSDTKGVVYYGHKESFGMGAPIGVDYNAVLVFNSTNSTYTFAKDSLEGANINEMKRFENESQVFFLIHKETTKKGKIFNVNRDRKLIKTRDVGFNYVKDSIPGINWEIGNETKPIGSFECMKATCNFRGRDYTAWFTTSIPLPFGPWKLQGLPGLILEAYDSNKEIYFYFKSIEYPSKKKLHIDVPDPMSEKKQWLSFEEYKKAIIKRHEIGVKRGLLFSEQSSLTLSSEHRVPMKNVFIEVFD